MKQQKLNFRFHDPNPEGVFAEELLKVLIEVNRKKVEDMLRAAADQAECECREKITYQQPIR